MLRSKGCHQPGRQGLRVKRQGSCVKARAGKGKGGRPWGYPMAASMNVRSHDLSRKTIEKPWRWPDQAAGVGGGAETATALKQ